MPAGFFALMKCGQGNWNYESVAQPNLNGRKMYCPLKCAWRLQPD
jgi:hypothetical protein